MAASTAAGTTDARFPLHVLRDYALLADGHPGALIGPRGECAWMCAPRWDSDAVFSDLVGGGGMYAVSPMGQSFVWGGHYEPGGLIWRSRWTTRAQIIECREALAFPGDAHIAVILRRVLAGDGDTRVRAVLLLRAEFGRHGMTGLRCRDGVWTARCGPLYVRWSGASEATARRNGSPEAELTVPDGSHHDLVLEISDQPLEDADPVDGERAWAETTEAWRRAVPRITGTVADTDARHSYAVLRGLTVPGGGTVAGATMCLPERAEEGRDYDYRRAWVRDQCFTGQAAAACGPDGLLQDPVAFVTERLLADGPQLKPAYTVAGGPVPDERDLDVPGYPGATTKIGNWANKQFQLDYFGEALHLFAAAARLDCPDSGDWHAVESAAAAIEQRGADPDSGIWELDGRWTHSRLTCVCGLRAIAGYAPAAQGAEWSALADAILADAAADCLHPCGRWQGAPGDDWVDQAGGQALAIPTDVAVAEQVEAAAAKTEQELGPIDVWVNVAFTSVFAPFHEITPAEFKRVTEVDYLGYVYSTMAALSRMRARDSGTIVHVGSALAYRGIPLRSAYCGAKHAIQGFHESLRCELLHEKSNVHVTMVQMPAVNTPQFDWVLSRLPKPAQPVPPIYQPEVAARAVLHAADHPRRREYWAGGSTMGTLIANAVAPGLLDCYLARTGLSSQQDDRPEPADRAANLWDPADGPAGHDYTAHGSFEDRSKDRSAQLWASQHHGRVAAVAGVLAATAVLVGSRGRR
ncbi:MAG TPA: SDR family oxidoreductase [Actinocrinis sp.]|nr:SDR family oxidoreductase [Actinocrinis sp.]